MVYLLEFSVVEADDKRVLYQTTYRAKSVERACHHAKSVMKNVKFEDRVAQLCTVKDQMGNILSVAPSGGQPDHTSR